MMSVLLMQMTALIFLKHHFLRQCVLISSALSHAITFPSTLSSSAGSGNNLEGSMQWSPDRHRQHPGWTLWHPACASSHIQDISPDIKEPVEDSWAVLKVHLSPTATPCHHYLYLFFFYHNHLDFWVIWTIRVINCMFAIKTEDQGGLHYRLNIFRKLYQLVDITNAISPVQHEAAHIVQTGLLWNSNLLKRSQSV